MNILECVYQFYLVAPNIETSELNFSHVTVVIGQLIKSSNNYAVITLKLYNKRLQYIFVEHMNFLTQLINNK